VENVELNALKYLKENKKLFFEIYLGKIEKCTEKIAIFTAGASGAGKTEYAVNRISKETTLLHIDIDYIRDFFEPIGYNGSNSSEYQRPASKGVHWLFDKSIDKSYCLIMDSNFAEITIAQKNVERLLRKGYIVEINYIFRNIEKSYEFAKKRETITKRKVPRDVVEKSFKNSFDTTLFIKTFFNESIILNFIDRENNKIYSDIDENEFLKIMEKEIL
jgi:predicted kinase